MKTTHIAAATLLAAGLVCASPVDDRSSSRSMTDGRTLAAEHSGEMYEAAARTINRPSDTTDTSGNGEVFRNVLIPAGKTTSVDSVKDYSAVNTVAVTVLCTTCTSSATSLGALGLVLQARWTFANADSFVATDQKSATTFLYWDAGATLFTAYGSRFRLTLQNKGSQTITIQQITIFPQSK